MNKIHHVAETSVELTLVLSSLPHYGEWHDETAKLIGSGHAGVVTMVANVAEQIERVIGEPENWSEYDWYLSVDAVAGALIQRNTATLTDDEIRGLLVPS